MFLFFEKVESCFPTFFNVHLVPFNVQHLKVQSTIEIIESTEYTQKYIYILSDVLCTLFLFPVEQQWIPTKKRTFQCTLYFQKWKYKIHPKVQSTSESTRYNVHGCFNPILRNRLKQKKGHFIQLIVTYFIILWKVSIWTVFIFYVNFPKIRNQELFLFPFFWCICRSHSSGCSSSAWNVPT